jgi:uncharacterized protein
MSWLLTRGRLPFLAALLGLTTWMLGHAVQVGVEKNNESLNSQDATEVATYTGFKEVFGSDEDLVLAVHHPHLLQPAGLQVVDAVSRRIAQLDGVRQVFSLTTATQVASGANGAEAAPLFAAPIASPEAAAQLTTALDRNPDFTGWLISADRRTAGIVIQIDDRPGNDEYRAALIDAIRALIAEYSRDGVSLYLTGIAVQKHDVTAFIERDRSVLMPLAVLTLAAVLAVFFRRLLGVALPLAVTGVSLASTLGAFHLAGLSVNAITALLPPVIMVLSIAVSVHLIQGWLQAPGDLGGVARIQHVVSELAFPCFFCSLTTALGFGSLMVADLPAVRQFGLFAALGVLVSFVVGMTLVPVGLTFLTPPASLFDTPQHRLMRRVLDWSADLAARAPGGILLGFTLVTVVAAAFVPLIRNNTDLVRFLKRGAPLYRDTMFIDEHLAGANAIEFVVRRVDGTPLTGLPDVARIAAFEDAVRAHAEVTGTTSILAVLRQLQRAEHGSEQLVLPDNPRDLGYLFDLLDAAEDRSLINKLITPDFRTARIDVRLHVVGTAVAAPLADTLTDTGNRIFGNEYIVTPTGAFYYMARDSNRLVDDQVGSFSVGLLTVFLAIGALFRSVKPTLISLIPNIMPVIWTAGIMGAFGIDLSTGTAMIASAVIGLVVDDTIHYLARFYREYRGDAAAAVRRTTAGVGAALVMNNLILVLGFWVGCFGSFKPTIYFSLLSGLTMITAMICDLFVTPACLILFDRRQREVAL